jgi:hypothetical protein
MAGGLDLRQSCPDSFVPMCSIITTESNHSVAYLNDGRESAPSNLIGANGFAEQDHCSRVCGAKHRRAAGAPLTVILNGKRILGTVGRVARTDRLGAVPETA